MARLLMSLLILAGCSDNDEPPTIKYLNEILDIMEKNSVNKKSIDWTSLRADALSQANGAQTTQDLYPAISTAIRGLGDHHSSYTRGTVTLQNYPVCLGHSAGVEQIDNIGYVLVPGFAGADGVKFASDIQASIKSQDNAGIIGWIVDLRGNNGGNMWPMIAGIGPVLGDGIAGYFIYPDGGENPYEYKDGSSIYSGTNKFCTVATPYTVIKPNPKVAVLIDQRTASSGEATAIAFIGRPNTKFFGISSCGLSTSNEGFQLSDGATLLLTTALLADRNKNAKGGALVPDVTILDDGEMVTQAVAWLNEP